MEPFSIILQVETIDRGRWQWRSNQDPWSKSEEPQWEFYSLEDNYLIEKAYYDKQKEVDLGGYVVSIKHMIQKKKGAVIQQRPIRRVSWEGDVYEKDRSSRYFETELPKTMNKVFGSLSDFVSFFSRRNPAILDFTRHFEEIEESKDLVRLNRGIVPEVICCLEIELMKSILEQLEDPLLSVFKKKILLKTKERHEELISLFKKEFGSFEEFYGEILRAYTMNTSLYENLNRYLRNESWIEIDNLLPYAFCLCKAFFNLKTFQNSRELNEIIKIEDEPHGSKSIFFYRGTAFDEGSLSFYQNPQTAQQLFSWNCVTSTSTNVEIARKFMYENVDLKNKKYPVIFFIEIPLSEDYKESEYLNWVDIQKYSAKTEENEVILAPGSVFEVVKVSTDKDQRTKIRLKMNHKVQSLAQGGLIMQGALQKKMMTEKDVKIVCLEGEELIDTLKCLAGNKLIEEVEFCMCKFDKRSLIAMMETLSTLERAKELKLISCEYQDQEEMLSELLQQVKRCNISKVEIFGSSGLDEMWNVQNEENVNWISLKELKVAFIGRENDSGDDGMHNQIFKRFRHFNQLLSLTLDFSISSHILDPTNISLIFYEIRHLTQLTSLTVSFKDHREITDEGVHSLACHGLKHLFQLTFLTLNFYECMQITDEGIKKLVSVGIGNLVQLTSLDLNFFDCEQITDEGISLAFQGLQNLTKLTSLTLDFCSCNKITNKGVESFVLQGLQYLTKLESLALDFGSCDITNKGVKSLLFQGRQYLTRLTSLTLSFNYCEKITNQGVESFVLQGLQYLTKLETLALDFGSCDITNKGVKSLLFQGLRYLTKLTSLTLSLNHCFQITDKGVGTFVVQGLQYLTKLESLTLDFSGCDITNKGVRSLLFQGLRYLTKLTSLTLNLTGCEGITDKGIFFLKDRILKYLSHLKFNFGNASQLHFYSTPNLKNLQSQQRLQTSRTNPLTLRRVLDKQKQLISKKEFSTLMSEDFKADNSVSQCSCEPSQELERCLKKDLVKIESSVLGQSLSLPIRINSTLSLTNSTLNLTNLSQLSSLTLDYSGSWDLTDEAVNLLSQKLRKMTQLTYLALNFSYCHYLTDEGVRSLAFEGLQNLIQLISLTIKFRWCDKISEEGVQSLSSKGLQHLTRLRFLTIKFRWRDQIADEGVRSLTSLWPQRLTNLAYLDLGFDLCKNLTDKGVQSLAQGLENLTQLTSLALNFWACSNITDEGMQSLVSQGLRNLAQLTSLALNFGCCRKITDKSIHILAFQGLKHMTQLSSLSLHFLHCDKVTDFMFSNISKVLHYLGFVEE